MNIYYNCCFYYHNSIWNYKLSILNTWLSFTSAGSVNKQSAEQSRSQEFTSAISVNIKRLCNLNQKNYEKAHFICYRLL